MRRSMNKVLCSSLMNHNYFFSLADPKGMTFSPGFIVPAGKLRLNPFPNRDYSPFLYQMCVACICQSHNYVTLVGRDELHR